MSKVFPTSWPYLNKHGVLFEKGELDELAKVLFFDFKPRSYEFGVELAWLLVWILEKATTKETVLNLSQVLFARIVRRKTFVEKVQGRYVNVGLEVVEEAVESGMALPELRIMFEHLVEGQITIKEILEMDRNCKDYLVRKLRKKFRRRDDQ